MHKFTDDAEREWKVSLTVGLMEEINDGIDVNLFEPVIQDTEKQAISMISPIGMKNIMRFVDMMFMICEDQCKEREIDSKKFGAGMGGKGISAAYEALYAEWMDLFQIIGRADLVETIAKYREIVEEETNDTAEQVKKVTLEEVILQAKTGLINSETES